MSNFSQETQRLISQYKSWYESKQEKPNVSTIHVDEVASRVASFYEKIRGIVDWREEHLMRRAAISRALKRRLFLLRETDTVAEALVLELIRGGHFPNDKIPAPKINDVQTALDKYIFLLEKLSSLPAPKKRKLKFGVRVQDWLIDIASCEIEEILSSGSREQALVEYMMASIKDSIQIRGAFKKRAIDEEEKNTQVYIAIHRALLKLDTPIISYNLLKRRFPEWRTLTKKDFLLNDISQNIYAIFGNLDKEFHHPLAEKFYRICEKYDTPYLIIGDMVAQDPGGISEKLQDPAETEKLALAAYDKRLGTSKSRVKRAAIYATLSIFVSKILLALALEIPIDKLLTGESNYPALLISVLFPPFLMLLLVLSISPPDKQNRQVVMMEVMKTLYSQEKTAVRTIEIRRRRGWLMNFVVNLLYLLAAVFSFGVIIKTLHWLEFPPVSYLIFIVFISLISFAGVKLRERSKELQVAESKGTFLGFFIDLFSLPAVSLGKWLSGYFMKYNIIMVFFNSLIDMPFQVFIEFLEQWRAFLKEKKEEIH